MDKMYGNKATSATSTTTTLNWYGSDENAVSIQPISSSSDRTDEIRANVLLWAIVDLTLMLFIFCGNTLTILAISLSRRIRSTTSSLFVLSLAISDILVGTTLPYHLAFYIGAGLGQNYSLCLMRFFLIIIACTVSIWNIIAIAIDRYVAIVYPLHYLRYITRKVAFSIMCMGWLVGVAIGLVPVLWNNWATADECEFDEILPPWYLAGVVTPIFIIVWIIMLVIYFKIWLVAARHAKQLRLIFGGINQESGYDRKSLHVVLLILGCFSICWLPYFTVACSQIYQLTSHSSPTVYKAAFTTAIANSGMNPIIYAWKNTTFRKAFGCLLRCRSPDSCEHDDDDDDDAGGAVRRQRRRCDHQMPNHLGAATTMTTSSSMNASNSIAMQTTNICDDEIIKNSIDHRPSVTKLFNECVDNKQQYYGDIDNVKK